MYKTVCCFIAGFFLLSGTSVLWGQRQGDIWDAGAFADEAWNDMERAFDTDPLSLEEEYYLGRAVAANILSVYRPYNGNPGLTGYLNRICQTIVINSPRPAIFNEYHVMILDSQEFNAFASPGGHVLISRGLVEAASSEEALAAVIAHELAHIMLRHAEAIIEHMDLAGQLNAIAGRAATLSGNSRAAQQALLLRNSTGEIVDTMMKNGYSQEQEFEADRYALELLATAGYDPRGVIEILRILERIQTDQQGGFNTTHPSPGARIANADNHVRNFQSPDTRSYRVPRFKNK